MAAGGPDGNTRDTRWGISMVRWAESVSVAARATRGRASADARPVANARRSSTQAIVRSRLSRFSVDRHHHVACLDDRIGVLALGELQFLGGLVGDRGRDGLSADVDPDVRRRGALLHVGDLALEDIARAQLHRDAPWWGREGASKP